MFSFLLLPAVTIDLTQQPGSSDLASHFGGTPTSFIAALLTGFMAIAALAVLIIFIQGALEWIFSGGEKGKVEQARTKMTTAVIGIIVLASVVAIFNLLRHFLGVDLQLGG